MQQAQNPLSSETTFSALPALEALLLSSEQEEGGTRLTQRPQGLGLEAERGLGSNLGFPHYLAPFKDGTSPWTTVIKPLAHHLLSFEQKIIALYFFVCIGGGCEACSPEGQKTAC